MQPITFEFSLQDFDLEVLPISKELLQGNELLLRKSIREYLKTKFEHLGGNLRITTYDDRVQVAWTPVSAKANWHEALALAVSLLRQGAFHVAESVLLGLERNKSDDKDLLYNFGMMLSDQGRLDDAITRLKKLVAKFPDFANGWIALGVALSRQGKTREALVVLEKAVELEPDNGYALRNLGGLLAKDNPSAALPYLKRTVELLPEDQQALYGYGLCLLKCDNSAEADRYLQKAIDVDSFSELAEVCRTARTQIAHKTMRKGAGDTPQMDVVMYCLAALKKFQELGPATRQKITMEVALLGRSGLDINNPDQKYTLDALPGQFTGRQLLAYMYVGLRQMAPHLDPGVDLSNEYAAALSLFEAANHGDASDAK